MEQELSRRAVHAWQLSFAFVFCAAFGRADVAILADGDRLTGTVIKVEQARLFFKSQYSETPLQIDWKLVTSLTTDPEMRVTFADGSERTGRLLPSSGTFDSQDEPDAIRVETPFILGVVPKEGSAPEDNPTWFHRIWRHSSTSADFGQSYSGLSQYNQLSSNTEYTYKGGRWDASFISHYNYYGATDSSGSTYQAYGRLVAERYLAGDHFFLFPYLFLGRQTSAEGGRGQLRQYGGGAGWTFRRQKPDQVSFYAGIVRSSASGFATVGDERVDTRLDGPLLIAATSWDRTFTRNITTSVRLYYFKPLLEAAHHGIATDASAKIPLFGPAYFTIRAYDTPELSQRHLLSTKNLQFSSGIGIEF